MVSGLPGDAEHVADVLPRPAPAAGKLDLSRLSLAEDPPQPGYRTQPGTWVLAPSQCQQIGVG